LFIFFFQAEDGIRDFRVTGVQTCALPICHLALPRAPREARREGQDDRRGGGVDPLQDPRRRRPQGGGGRRSGRDRGGLREDGHRSEERRVGKECRGRERQCV